MARFDILHWKILAYSSNTDLQKLQIQKTGCSKIAPVKEHNFFGPLRNSPIKSLIEESIFLLKWVSFGDKKKNSRLISTPLQKEMITGRPKSCRLATRVVRCKNATKKVTFGVQTLEPSEIKFCRFSKTIKSAKSEFNSLSIQEV